MDLNKFLKDIYWTNDLHNGKKFDDMSILSYYETTVESKAIKKSLDFDKHERTIKQRYIVHNRSTT